MVPDSNESKPEWVKEFETAPGAKAIEWEQVGKYRFVALDPDAGTPYVYIGREPIMGDETQPVNDKEELTKIFENLTDSQKWRTFKKLQRELSTD